MKAELDAQAIQGGSGRWQLRRSLPAIRRGDDGDWEVAVKEVREVMELGWERPEIE